MSSSKKQVLVLGGSRFVGPAVLAKLFDFDYSVTVLNRGTRPMDGTRQLVADRNDIGQMSSVVGADDFFDTVIDLSCYTPMQADIAWQTLREKTDRWVYLSSVAVYQVPSLDSVESNPIGSHDVWGAYGQQKSDVDAFLLSKEDPACIIVRPPYLYGPENTGDRETFVWRRALQSKPVLIPGDGTMDAHFLHRDDLASAICALAFQPQLKYTVYNVSTDEPVSFRQYVTELARLCGASDPGVVVGEADNGFAARDYFPFGNHPCGADASRLRDECGWIPQYSFTTGHTQTYKSYSKEDLLHGDALSPIEEEIIRRMG